MSSPIISLPCSATVKKAIETMCTYKIKHLPVTDDITNKEEQKIIGTVTQEYLAKQFV